MKRLTGIITLIIINFSAFAEAEKSTQIGSGNSYLDLLFIATAILVILLLWVSVALLKIFKSLSAEILNPKPIVIETIPLLEFEDWLKVEKEKPSIWNKILSLRPLSEEEDMKLEHEFDGITELDNPTPAWFNWLFYGSIVVAIGYMLFYHVFDYGKLQDEEYAIEMRDAKVAKDAYLANAANLIDENTVVESKDPAVIAKGKALFTTSCVACHGSKGEGVVGPNLTDEYSLHGSSINNIFKTIKYGVPEKGMISWEKTLSPQQISELASFIKSIKGSKPENPKAPQGDKEG